MYCAGLSRLAALTGRPGIPSLARQNRIDERPERRIPQQKRWRGGTQDRGGICVVGHRAYCGTAGLAANGQNDHAAAFGRRPAGPLSIVIAADAAGAPEPFRNPCTTAIAFRIRVRASGAAAKIHTTSSTRTAGHRTEQADTRRAINSSAGSGATTPPRS